MDCGGLYEAFQGPFVEKRADKYSSFRVDPKAEISLPSTSKQSLLKIEKIVSNSPVKSRNDNDFNEVNESHSEDFLRTDDSDIESDYLYEEFFDDEEEINSGEFLDGEM